MNPAEPRAPGATVGDDRIRPAAGQGSPVVGPGRAEALLRLAGRLPLGLLRGLGAALGLVALVVSPSYRRKLRANLQQAGYRHLSVRLAAAAEAGRTLGELAWVWSRPVAAVAARVSCDALYLIEQAEQRGRGIVFVTPHLGAFDVTARFYAARAPIVVMFKPPRQPWLRPLVELSRSAESLRAVPAAGAGVRAMLRALRAGGAVGLLPDQVPALGEGVWAPFFNALAYSMTLPQGLVKATGAAVVLAAGIRVRGGWRLHLEAFEGVPDPAALNARMESLIRRWPTQYLWGYNRYRQPAERRS